ncbi:MAG: hypothetical protein QW820_05685 [Sulfolobales archaeon]
MSEFWFQCLKNGHAPVVIRFSSFGLLYVKCPECNRVWRFHIFGLDWVTVEEFNEMSSLARELFSGERA